MGYWVAVTENKTIPVSGTPVTSWADHPLVAGWNMVGSIYGSTPTVSSLVDDPAGSILDSAVYWWDPDDKSYTGVDSIVEGQGYWMATTQNCTLTMQPSA